MQHIFFPLALCILAIESFREEKEKEFMFIYGISQENGERTKDEKVFYTDQQQALDAFKKLLVPVAREMGVDDCIQKIRNGKDVKYRKAIADFLEEFFGTESCPVTKNELCGKETQEDFWRPKVPPKDPLKEFDCFCDYGNIICVYFNFGKELSLETNLWTFGRNGQWDFHAFDYEYGEIYFRIYDNSEEARVYMTINEVEHYFGEKTHSANILLVYHCLTEQPKTRKKIAEEIWERYHLKLSEKTIGAQIDALKKLGLPICHRNTDATGIVANQAIDQTIFYLFGDVIELPKPAGFYLDWSKQGSVQREAVQQIGTKAYPLLILLTLQDAQIPMKTGQIMEAVWDRYGVKISKGAILRNMKLLEQLKYIHEGDEKGYTAEGHLLRNI